MANTYKNIVITPNIGNTADPRIQFSGGNTSANTDINLYVYPDANGTLSFEGSAGQLFSITNDLANSLFSVNDVSGIPAIEIFANGLISVAPFGGNVVIGNTAEFILSPGAGIYANGSLGTAGQALHSNGTSVYWTNVASEAVTSVATGNGLVGGTITNTGTISVLANTGIVANSTGLFVNATYIGTLTANNTSFVGTVSAANVVSNAQLSGNLANYQTTAGLAGNVATLTANNTSFVGTVSAANVVSNAQLSGNLANYVTATNLTNNLANYQTTAGLTANVATLTANNANNLNGQPASFYTNATNITTGTLPYAQIPANVINTTADFTRTGITTFSANVVLGSSGVSANGSFGVSGDVLYSNGSATYWSAPSGGGATANLVTLSSVTAISSNRYILTNTSPTTVTLPASPVLGDTVYILPTNGLANNVVARNGNKIMGLSEDMTIDVENASIDLIYVDTNLGWRIV
jgi:hypothetical protein